MASVWGGNLNNLDLIIKHDLYVSNYYNLRKNMYKRFQKSKISKYKIWDLHIKQTSRLPSWYLKAIINAFLKIQTWNEVLMSCSKDPSVDCDKPFVATVTECTVLQQFGWEFQLQPALLIRQAWASLTDCPNGTSPAHFFTSGSLWFFTKELQNCAWEKTHWLT